MRGIAATIAPATSPSVISRTRAPAARISPIISAWRGRSRIVTVTSSGRLPLAFATCRMFSATGASMSIASAASGPVAIFSMYIAAPGKNIEPRGASAMTDSAFGCPTLVSVVPSIGSTATSVSGPTPLPTCSPLNSMGASSFSPSPITTTPSIETESIISRIASTAAASAAILSPRPTQRPDASAAASVTRTSSMARLRSGSCLIAGPPGCRAGRLHRTAPGGWPHGTAGRGGVRPPNGPHRGSSRPLPR